MSREDGHCCRWRDVDDGDPSGLGVGAVDWLATAVGPAGASPGITESSTNCQTGNRAVPSEVNSRNRRRRAALAAGWLVGGLVGAPPGIRTQNLRIKSPLLCH